MTAKAVGTEGFHVYFSIGLNLGHKKGLLIFIADLGFNAVHIRH